MQKNSKVVTMKAGKGKKTLLKGTKKEAVKKRDAKKACLIKDTAEITGYTQRYVQMVVKGDEENEQIMLVYMELSEGNDKLVETIKGSAPFEAKNRELVMGYLPGEQADQVKETGVFK